MKGTLERRHRDGPLEVRGRGVERRRKGWTIVSERDEKENGTVGGGL